MQSNFEGHCRKSSFPRFESLYLQVHKRSVDKILFVTKGKLIPSKWMRIKRLVDNRQQLWWWSAWQLLGSIYFFDTTSRIFVVSSCQLKMPAAPTSFFSSWHQCSRCSCVDAFNLLDWRWKAGKQTNVLKLMTSPVFGFACFDQVCPHVSMCDLTNHSAIARPVYSEFLQVYWDLKPVYSDFRPVCSDWSSLQWDRGDANPDRLHFGVWWAASSSQRQNFCRGSEAFSWQHQRERHANGHSNLPISNTPSDPLHCPKRNYQYFRFRCCSSIAVLTRASFSFPEKLIQRLIWKEKKTKWQQGFYTLSPQRLAGMAEELKGGILLR